MSSLRVLDLKSIFLIMGAISVLQLTACKESTQKTAAPKASQKKSGDSLPAIPESEFPSAAKDRLALKDVSNDLWTLQSFSSVTQSLEGKDQFYIATSFSVPHDGKILSECNATGKFATALLKAPASVRSAAQIPTQIDLDSDEPFKAIYTLRYGAIVDLEISGCTPIFQWKPPTNSKAVVELLTGLNKADLVEKTSETSGSKLQAAMTQSKDELVLHYKTEAKDTVTTSKFVYTRDAKPVVPEAKKPVVAEPAPVSPEVKPLPEVPPKTSPDNAGENPFENQD